MSSGGKRAGAGRKCDADQPRVIVSMSVDVRTADLMKMLRSQNIKVNHEFDKWIVKLAEDLQIHRK